MFRSSTIQPIKSWWYFFSQCPSCFSFFVPVLVILGKLSFKQKFFLAVLHLRCCTWAFSSCNGWGYFPVMVHGFLFAVSYHRRALGALAQLLGSMGFVVPQHVELEKEMATHSSILAGRILWTEEPGGLLSMGSHRVGYDWSDLACMRALEKEMATHSSILAWRIPGTEEPGWLPSMGSHRVGHNWSNLATAAAACGIFLDQGLNLSPLYWLVDS